MQKFIALGLGLAAVTSVNAEPRLITLSEAETARYVQLSWSAPGIPVPVSLSPVENLSLRESSHPQSRQDASDEAVESGDVPISALDALWRQQVDNSGVFEQVGGSGRYRLDLDIVAYHPRYASDSTGWWGDTLEWTKASMGVGSGDASVAAVRLHAYDANATHPMLEVEVRGGLRACALADFGPTTKTGGPEDAFLNNYGHTAIGQTVYALMNRALAELVGNLAPTHPYGQVVSVARGEVIVSLDNADVGERVRLLYPDNQPYAIGDLLITGGEPGRYRAIPRDLPVNAIIPGDTVVSERPGSSAVYTPLGPTTSHCASTTQT